MFLLLLLPGAGDELQGIKRGIVELADMIVVNKADGDLAGAANRSAADYRGALGFLHPRRADWTVPVTTCSATEGTGIAEIWDDIEAFRATMTANGSFATTRAAQAKSWLWSEVAETLLESLRRDERVAQQVAELERAVADEHISPWVAAQRLVETFRRQG